MCPKLHIHLIVKTDTPQAWLKILLRVNSMIMYVVLCFIYFIFLFMEAVSELAFLTSFILMMTCFTISWGWVSYYWLLIEYLLMWVFFFKLHWL